MTQALEMRVGRSRCWWENNKKKTFFFKYDSNGWIHLTKNNIQWPSRLSGNKPSESAWSADWTWPNDLQVRQTTVSCFGKYDSQQRIHQHVSVTKLLIRQHNAMKHFKSLTSLLEVCLLTLHMSLTSAVAKCVFLLEVCPGARTASYLPLHLQGSSRLKYCSSRRGKTVQ